MIVMLMIRRIKREVECDEGNEWDIEEVEDNNEYDEGGNLIIFIKIFYY